MKLEFTPEYLEELEKFRKKYSVSKKLLLQRIDEALEKADEFDISYALENGLFTCDSSEYEAAEVDDEGAGFQMFVTFNCLYRSNCTNWEQYFTHRLKEFKDKE
ncbi:hypothetical protein [Turicimonas sp. TL08]